MDSISDEKINLSAWSSPCVGASRGFIAKCCKWDEGLSYNELGCIIDEGQNLQVFDVAEILMCAIVEVAFSYYGMRILDRSAFNGRLMGPGQH